MEIYPSNNSQDIKKYSTNRSVGFAHEQGLTTRRCKNNRFIYSGLNLNQDKATKPQTVQIVRQGEVRQRRTGLKLIHYTSQRSPENLVFTGGSET